MSAGVPLPHAGAQLGELPSATMLGAVTEFAQHEATMAATQQQESLSSILASAETTPHPIAAPKPTSTVMLGTGLPPLPKKLVDKILAGEYVDFAELPPARGKAQAVPQALEGQIVVVQTADLLQSRCVIPDLATWMQCYAIFTAVIASKNPVQGHPSNCKNQPALDRAVELYFQHGLAESTSGHTPQARDVIGHSASKQACPPPQSLSTSCANLSLL